MKVGDFKDMFVILLCEVVMEMSVFFKLSESKVKFIEKVIYVRLM